MTTGLIIIILGLLFPFYAKINKKYRSFNDFYEGKPSAYISIKIICIGLIFILGSNINYKL